MNTPKRTEKRKKLNIIKKDLASLDDEQIQAISGGELDIINSCIDTCQNTYIYIDEQVVANEKECRLPI